MEVARWWAWARVEASSWAQGLMIRGMVGGGFEEKGEEEQMETDCAASEGGCLDG